MRCGACQNVAPAGSRFCNACGRPLASGESATRALPETGDARALERDPRSYTPEHLARKILQSKSALEGERKQVTVLFADVKGSMELSEELDPEAWHAILDRFFQILTEGIHRFEGTVNQYTGDGIMALFGAPIGHEDHAQRACYAALHLREGLGRYADALRLERGLAFSVRMGLNSGDVVVGKIGDDLRMDYTAQGHTVGLAARMQQIAAADRIYAAEATVRLARGFFDFRDLGAARVKGVREPVPTFELTGVGQLRTRFDASRARGLSGFVGRADEMGELEAALALSIQGEGQVVGVSGEAGLGKSRLCFEFAERCRARGIESHQVQVLSHGKSTPLRPVIEFLRASCGVEERDDERSARDKIAGHVLLLDESLRDALPLLFDFLEVPDPERPAPQLDPTLRQRRLFDTIRDLVRARSLRAPRVLVFEDLHWIDEGSEAFLENLIGAIPETRTLLLANFRPEYRAPWTQRKAFRPLSLRPLDPETVRKLVAKLLGRDPSVAGLADRLHAHTGGNPFFVEESVRALIEAERLEGSPGAYRLAGPLERLEIPETVQALLAARIDRLPERHRRTLHTASVLGKRFEEPLLRRVTELPEAELLESLSDLVAGGLLYPESLYPESVYAFVHPLTQEVAYGSQLSEPRRRVHVAVARALEEADAGRSDSWAALLAHHWDAGGDAVAAARWHCRAAAWIGFTDIGSAMRHWERGWELLEAVPESPETSTLRLTACGQLLAMNVRLGRPAAEAEALLARGREPAQHSSDPRDRAVFLHSEGIYRFFRTDFPASVGSHREARRIADETGDANLRAVTRMFLHTALFFTGPLDEALALVEDVDAIRRDIPNAGEDAAGINPGASVLAFRGWYLTALGRPDEALTAMRRAAERVRRDGDTFSLATVEWMQGFREWVRQDGPPALAHARRAVEAAERVGTANILGPVHTALAFAYELEGRWREALAAAAQSVERGNAGPMQLVTGPVVAVARLELGDESGARAAAEAGVAIANRSGARVWEVCAQTALAQVLRRLDGAEARVEIERALDRALELVAETRFLAREPAVHVERAELAALLGDSSGRERALREAARLYRGLGAAGPAERIERQLGA